MAYQQLGVNPARADDTIDKAYVDAGTSGLLSAATWEGWLTSDWNALLGWFGSPTPGTTTQTSVWNNIVSNIINPLNTIEVQASNIIGQIEQSAINGLATSLSALLGTTAFQALLDGVANALGHSGTGHTVTNIETYLGIIPPANVTNVLGTSTLATDVQAILDYIASALGYPGTGHTLTQIETYLGLIPSANVTNVLGKSSLGADVQAILDFVANGLGHAGTGHTLTQIEGYLGIIPATNVSNVLGGSSLGADVSSVSTTATTATNNVLSTWSWLFGTTTPTGASSVQSTKIANVLGGSSLGADVQAILDFVANGLGHAGTGHTLTQIETYLGLIPAGNVTGTFPQSQITGLATALSNLLGTTTFQSLLDGISNALGQSGTGHTITQVETYLGLIPPTNVTNVLGGSSLGADVSAVNTTTTSHANWFTQILTALGLGGGTGTGTNIAGAISSAASTASSAATTATTATTNLTNTWSWVFGTTTPTSSTPVQSTKVGNVLGGTSLGADLGALSTALYGGTTVGATVQVAAIPSGIPQNNISGLVTSLSSLLGTTTFQALLDGIANALGQSGTGHTVTQVETYLGLIPSGNVTGTFPQSQITGLATALSNLLGTTTFQSLLDGIANALGQSGTGHTVTQVEGYLGLIPSANVSGSFPQSQITGLATSLSNLLGTTTFQSLLDGIANTFGHAGTGHTITDIETYLGIIPPANVAAVLGGSNLGADLTSVNSTATTASSTASTANTTANTATTNINNTWSWLFNTTTPTNSTPVQSTKIANVLGGSSLGADVQSILDFIANGLGHTGTGHTLTQIEGYLGLIPAANVTGTFPQSQITGLATALSNLLGTTTFQNLLDGISNALGQSGTGHTITQVETYLGLIPPANVTNVLGGANLGADVSSVSAVTTTHDNWFTQILTALGLSGGSGTGTTIAGAISTAQSTASGAASTASSAASTASAASSAASTNATNISNIVGSVFTGLGLTGTATTTAIQTQLTDWVENLFGVGANPATAPVQTAVLPNIAPGSGAGQSASLQNVADAVHQTVYGGSATGTPMDVATLVTALSNQPSATVLPAPNPSSTGIPMHGAGGTGLGFMGSSTASTLSTTGSITLLSTDNYIIVPVLFCTSSSLGSISASVTVGTQTMSAITGQAIVWYNTSQTNVYYLQYFGLFNPPTGSALTVTATATVTGGGAVTAIRAFVDSYSGVASVSFLNEFQLQNASNPSQSGLVSNASSLVINAFAATNTAGTISLSGYNHTQRNNSGNIVTGFTNDLTLVSGEVTGATSVSFSASASTTASTEYWGAIAINLQGAGSTPLGSVFRQHRASTSSLSASTGLGTAYDFPASFFDTNDQITPDFTYNSSTNTLTCLNAGTFTFKVAAVMTLSVGTAMIAVSACLFKNGSLYEVGVGSGTGMNGFGSEYLSSRFGSVFTSVYCNVNDTITAGYYIDGNGSVTSLSITGSSNGALAYFGAALDNRSYL